MSVKPKDGDIHPAIGVHQDITRFIEAFSKLASYQYKDFSKLWREWRLHEITYGRYTEGALFDFLQCLFHQLITLSQCVHSRDTQVCSVYLMYAFFMKQPHHFRQFFRLTMTEFDGLMNLTDYWCKEGHIDCVFIMKRLFECNAFRMCATQQPYYPGVPKFTCFEDIIASLDDDNLTETSQKKKNSTAVSQLISQEEVMKLSEVHEIYQKMKEEFTSAGGQTPHSLTIVPADVVEKIQQLISHPVSKPMDVCLPVPTQSKEGGAVQTESIGAEEGSSSGNVENYADRRQMLKSSGFDNTVKVNWRAKQAGIKRTISECSSDSNDV